MAYDWGLPKWAGLFIVVCVLFECFVLDLGFLGAVLVEAVIKLMILLEVLMSCLVFLLMGCGVFCCVFVGGSLWMVWELVIHLLFNFRVVSKDLIIHIWSVKIFTDCCRWAPN